MPTLTNRLARGLLEYIHHLDNEVFQDALEDMVDDWWVWDANSKEYIP